MENLCVQNFKWLYCKTSYLAGHGIKQHGKTPTGVIDDFTCYTDRVLIVSDERAEDVVLVPVVGKSSVGRPLRVLARSIGVIRAPGSKLKDGMPRRASNKKQRKCDVIWGV